MKVQKKKMENTTSISTNLDQSEKNVGVAPIDRKLKKLKKSRPMTIDEIDGRLPDRYAKFWTNDPAILFNKDHIVEIYPSQTLDFADKLNAITRAIILMTTIGFVVTRQWRIIVSGVISIMMIVFLYMYKKREHEKRKARKTGDDPIEEGFTNNEQLYDIIKDNFSEPTKTNPMMNPLLTDITDNPQRKQAAPAFNRTITDKINKRALEFIEGDLDDRLFNDLGDEILFDLSMRNFYTMPATTIPNNQQQFAQYCYGNMPSCKEGNAFQCAKNNIGGRKVIY